VSVLTIGGVLALPTPAGAERTPATESASPLRDAIVFTRFLPDVEMGVVYRLDAGETLVRPIHSVFDAAILSPDGSRFLDFGPTPYGRGSTGIFNIDGSGYHVLPLRDPTLELPGGKWTSRGNRIASEGFSNAGVTNGIYSRRSSDGGGLLRLTDAGTRNDYPAKASPDGSELLFFRPDAPHETSDSAAQDLFVVASRTGPTIRLTPKSVTTGIVFSDDSVSWSARLETSGRHSGPRRLLEQHSSIRLHRERRRLGIHSDRSSRRHLGRDVVAGRTMDRVHDGDRRPARAVPDAPDRLQPAATDLLGRRARCAPTDVVT
jgi:hypothetical protein